MEFVTFFFGEKETSLFFDSVPQPCRLCPGTVGFSHGLKTCHRPVILDHTNPIPCIKKTLRESGGFFYMAKVP